MADKPEVKVIFAQVRAPRDASDPGAAVEGRYVCEDGFVTLTDHDGTPVRDEHGKYYRQKLVPTEDKEIATREERQAASRLTKDFRLRLRGKDGGRKSGFEAGPIRYPKIKVI